MKKHFSLLLMVLLLIIQGAQAAVDYLYFSDYSGLRYKAIIKEYQGWEGSGSDLHPVTKLYISYAIVCEPAVGNYVGIKTIPETVEFYGDDYVWKDHGIVHFDPKTLKVIRCESGIFEHCLALKKVSFPTSYEQVYDKGGNPTMFNSLGVSFKDCSSLLEVENMNLSSIYANQFEGCSSLKKMDLSKTTDIWESAFSGCSSLEELTFKSNVQIRDNAFSNCNAIKKITVQSESNPNSFNDNVFTQTVYEQATLIVPKGKVNKYKRTNGWKNFFKIYEEGSEPSTDPTIEPTDSVTLMVNSYSRQYGEDNPTFEYTVVSGKVESGTPTITCAATKTSPVGTYDIIIEKGSVSNKFVTLVNGTLTITKAPLTISVGNYSKVEGEANPSFTLSYSGFKNGENSSILTKQPTISCSATASSAPGTYPITVSGAEAQNYNISYKNGTLTITAKQTPPVEEAKPYVVYNNGTLTFYCDNQRSSRQGTTYNLNEGDKAPMWLEHDISITKAVFDASFADARPTTTRSWFYGCSSMTDIMGIGYLNTSDVEDMSQMFRECKKLNSLDVSKFNTSKVTDMAYMFDSCYSLTSLDVSKFNTANVTSMIDMFLDCKKITSIDVGNFKTDKVTNMRLMFAYCQGLTKLDLHNFNTANVTDMSSMFDNCSSLAVLDVSSFNTAKVTSMTQMFLDCSNLISIDVSRFNTSNVTEMANLFSGCSKLTNLNVSNFNTTNVTSMNGMFNGCNNLVNLDVSHFNTEKVTAMTFMFNGCSSLTELDISSFNTVNVTNVSKAFKGCVNLTNLIIGNHFTSNESTNVSSIFYGCYKLNEVTFTGDIPSSINSKFFEGVGTADSPATLDVPEAYKANYQMKFDGNMFYGGYFTLSGSDDNPPVGDVEPYVVYNDITLTFYYDNQRSSRQGIVYSLNEGENDPKWVLDDNNRNVKMVVFDASFAKARPTTTYSWFLNCDYLTEIKGIENLNTSEVKNMHTMFAFCKRLKSLDVSHFDTKAVQDMGAMFSCCTSLEDIDLRSFDTSNVFMLLSMFNDCPSLTELDLSNFNTSRVEYMDYMFNGCSNLTTLYLGSKFTSTDNVGCDEAFAGCQSLSKVVFTGDIPASINSKFFEGVGTADSPAILDVPEQFEANYAAKFNGNKFYGGYFTLREEIEPDDNGGQDYGNGNGEIDETTNLNGNIIGNVYYQISPDKGGYNSAEGCLVVTEPSSDADLDYDNPFGDEFKNMYTGIVIMVQSGSGTIKVEAETYGGMTLKVKVGNNSPITMSFQNKSTLSIPYTVTRPSYVYIYAGGPNATRAVAEGALKIYSFSWESSASGIDDISNESQTFDVYSLSGAMVKKGATSLNALPKGVYIVNARKVVIK